MTVSSETPMTASLYCKLPESPVTTVIGVMSRVSVVGDLGTEREHPEIDEALASYLVPLSSVGLKKKLRLN